MFKPLSLMIAQPSSLINTLRRSTVQQAYCEALTICKRIKEPNKGGWAAKLPQWMRPHVKEHRHKTHIQFSLDEVDQLRHRMTTRRISAEDHALVASLFEVEAHLRRQSLMFLDQVLDKVPSASDIRHNIGRRSVFRIWIYFRDGECRPHYDPGLCTSLLCGSSEGLALNFVDTLVPSRRMGDYTGMDDSEAARLAQSPHWQRAEALLMSSNGSSGVDDAMEPIITMSGTCMQVITSGAVPHVLHCVMDAPIRSCDASGEAARVNIILELRPAAMKRWYRFQPTADEWRRLNEGIM